MATRVIVIDFDRRLIQLVERNPILWDTRTDSYKLSEKKPSVWADIADEIETSPGIISVFIQRQFKVALYKYRKPLK